MLQSLGAELVEDIDPAYPDDPSIPNMTFGFNQAFAEVLPFQMPEIFSWQRDGKPAVHAGGLGRHQPQVPGRAFGAQAPLPDGMNFNTVFAQRAEQSERRERLYVCLPVRPVPRAARRQPRVRLGDVERQRQVLQRRAPRGDEELGEQGDGHPHECHHVHDEAPRYAAHGHDEGAACRTISTCSSTR